MFIILSPLDFFRKLGKNSKIKLILRSTLVGPGIFLSKIRLKILPAGLLSAGVLGIILGLALFNLLGGEKGAFILRAQLGGPEVEEEEKIDLSNAVKNNGVVSFESETVLSPQDKEEEDEIVDFLGYLVVGEDAVSSYLSPLAIMNVRTELINYEVQEGDTPAKIAEAFGITTNTLLWANGLTRSSYIRPGQKLVILPVSGVKHEVKPGDTVAALVKKYGGQEDRIIAFNNLPPDGSLKPGMTLIIPDGRMPVTVIPRATSGTNLPVLSGYFIYPTTGYNWGRLHSINAVDIANQCGTPVFAAAAGIVSEAVSTGVCRSCNRGYGLYILIEHFNGTKTRYAHLSRLTVSAGSYVDQGQLIGYMGNTGKVYGATGCHLHFEVHGARNPLAK